MKNRSITCTAEDLARAFTLWQIRYRDNPDAFDHSTPASMRAVGESSADYLTTLLSEVQGK